MKNNLHLNKFLLAVFAFSLSFGSAAAAEEMAMPAPAEMAHVEAANVRIVLTEANDLRVLNASGMTLEVYNITGVKLLSIKIDSSDKTCNVNLGKGCYIVKVGRYVRKIFIS